MAVSGRYNGFGKKVEAGPPDVVVTTSAVIEGLGGYSVVLKGSRNGTGKESNAQMSDNGILTYDMVARKRLLVRMMFTEDAV